MKIHYFYKKENKCILNLTFESERILQEFIRKLFYLIGKKEKVSCLIKDIDADFDKYILYFNEAKILVFDEITSFMIAAFEMNEQESMNVINNWGFFTFEALLAFGELKISNDIDEEKIKDVFKKSSILIEQVLDSSMVISFDENYRLMIIRLIEELK